MAGHSQYANIMHRKGKQDAARAKIFAKLAREIIVAAKAGLPDPEKNAKLRAAVLAARKENMPKDNIERAIKKAQGGDAETYEEVRYEGFGPGGVALIVEALTDNRNRTAGDVRSIFTKHGGQMGENGSVAFMFNRVGSLLYPVEKGSADAMLEAAIEAGADECLSGEEGHEFLCNPDDFASVRDALEKALGPANAGRIIWKAQNSVAVDEESGAAILKLIDALDDNDDVQRVYANFEMSDAVMEKLTAA